MATKKDRGWIKLHRKIIDCVIWSSPEPFDRRSAWIDLLLMANHEARTIMLADGTEQLIQAGQCFTSLEHLAERWQWSRNKVRRYLAALSAQGMVTTTGTRRGTLLTIENWRIYQQNGGSLFTDGPPEGPPEGPPDGTSDGSPGEPRTRNIKNVYKNVTRKDAHASEFESLWEDT